ncbi:MAG: DUF6924 domain-containing protein [Methyloligellaceae bacterium]
MSKFFTYGWIPVLLVSVVVIVWLNVVKMEGVGMQGTDQAASLVIRTDFSDDALYRSVCDAIRKPQDGFTANVRCVSDRQYDALSIEKLAPLIDKSKHSFIFVIDQTTLSKSDNPVLVVDLASEPHRTFRVLPSLVWGVESNLSIANMGFEEFVEIADSDGVVREVM